MLTGDKTNTAIEIGNSCGLLDRRVQNIAVMEEWVPEEHGSPPTWEDEPGIPPGVLVDTRNKLLRLLRETEEADR